jgi:hypothetical protein
MRSIATILLSAACALLGASTAGAASLVYLDSGNDVAVARPDGSGAKKVTHATDADHGYKAISVADDGGITAFLRQRDDSGNSSFVVLDQNGNVLKGPFLFERYGICGGLAPFRTATTPDGSFTAVVYWKGSSNCLGGSPTTSTRLVSRNSPTIGTDTYPSYDYLTEPRWLRHPDVRLAGINGGTLSVWQNDGAHMDPWLALPAGSPDELDSFDFHPTDTKLLLDFSQAAVTGSKPHRLELYSYTEMSTGSAALTDPNPQFICAAESYVTDDTGGGRPSWSPDGTQIAWRGVDGIYVSPAPVASGGTCTLQPRLVVPGGTDPHWASFDVSTPPAPVTPAPPSSPPPSKPTPGTTTPAKRAAVFSSARVASGRRAFTVQLRLARAATVTITVYRVGTKRALGKLSYKAKKGTFKRKVTKVGRTRLARGTYRVVIRAQTTTKTLTVKVRP